MSDITENNKYFISVEYDGLSSNLINHVSSIEPGWVVFCKGDGVIAKRNDVVYNSSITNADTKTYFDLFGDDKISKWESSVNETQDVNDLHFVKLSKNNFDALEKKHNNLYVVSDNPIVSTKNKKLYVGKDILGDAYNTQKTNINIPKNIGNIKEGTSINNLITKTSGSLSKIIDEILFPVYAPCYHPQSGKCYLNDDSTKTEYYIFSNYTNSSGSTVENYMPILTTSDITNSYMSTQGIGNVNTFSYSLTQTLNGEICGKTITNKDLRIINTNPTTRDTYEKWTYTVDLNCPGSGDSVVRNSDGTLATKYALTKDVYKDDANMTEYLDQDSSKILRSTKNIYKVTIYSVLPIFVDNYIKSAEQVGQALNEGLEIELQEQVNANLIISNLYEPELYIEDGGTYSDLNLIPYMTTENTRYGNFKEYEFNSKSKGSSAKYLLKLKLKSSL